MIGNIHIKIYMLFVVISISIHWNESESHQNI